MKTWRIFQVDAFTDRVFSGRVECEYRGDRVALKRPAVFYLVDEITVQDLP